MAIDAPTPDERAAGGEHARAHGGAQTEARVHRLSVKRYLKARSQAVLRAGMQ
jgi:hypothetical protein